MVKDLTKLIGREARLVTQELLSVGVTVIDARRCYGRVDLKVQPLVGAGAAWVDAQRVQLVKAEEARA
jgi:hypothetical protein